MSWDKCRKAIYVIGVLCLVWVGVLPVLVVQAQDLTELRIRPEISEATKGDMVTVTVDVIRGENLSGYDITIIYDPVVVDLASWAHGSYLSNLAVIKTELEPGRIRLAAVQVGVPGVSGDGTLLILNFEALHAGESAIVIESVELATAESTRVIPALADGLIVVNLPATETPIPSSTATFTPPPTITLTGTPTRTHTIMPTKSTGTAVTLTSTPVQDDLINGATATDLGEAVQMTFTPLPSMAEAETSSTATRPMLLQTDVSQVVDSQSLTSQSALSIPNNKGSTSIRELNRLLWGFAVFLLVVLACFVWILVKHKKNNTGKG